MRAGELKVRIEDWNGVPAIVVEGEVDLATVDTLRSAASRVVRNQPSQVVFDLRKVPYMDSSGLGILVATRRRVGSRPDSVVVITDQPAVLHSLRLTGLDQVVTVLREPPAVRLERRCC